jgi:transcriptional regulator with XRE-family HTH domain
MGTKPRSTPERLAGKLRQIRDALGLSQSEMLKRLGVEDLIVAKQISAYELGKREPTLLILLQYARAGGVNAEALIDDEMSLPDRLPGTVKHDELKRAYTPRRKKR